MKNTASGNTKYYTIFLGKANGSSKMARLFCSEVPNAYVTIFLNIQKCKSSVLTVPFPETVQMRKPGLHKHCMIATSIIVNCWVTEWALNPHESMFWSPDSCWKGGNAWPFGIQGAHFIMKETVCIALKELLGTWPDLVILNLVWKWAKTQSNMFQAQPMLTTNLGI